MFYLYSTAITTVKHQSLNLLYKLHKSISLFKTLYVLSSQRSHYFTQKHREEAEENEIAS